MNFKKLMLSVGLSAMALLAMPGSTLTSPVWSYVKKKYKLNVTNFPFFCNC